MPHCGNARTGPAPPAPPGSRRAITFP